MWPCLWAKAAGATTAKLATATTNATKRARMIIPPCRLPDGDEHSHIKDLETQRCRRVHTPGHFPDPAARRILRHRPRAMSSFTVHTPALAAAALTISANAGSVSDATTAAQSAAAAAGAFGGEPIGAAFLDMCSRAQTATQALQTTMESLSHNVAAASVGYLVTDQGVVPTKALPGFKP